MKQAPDISKAQKSMEAGVITADGFLGDDKRPLVDIIAHDEEAFSHLGLDFSEAADQLQDLMDAGQKGLGEEILVKDTWIVRTDEARGFIPSPFGDGVHHKVNVFVEKKSSGKRLIFSELNIHMMRDHHFLEGIGSAFRIDPETLKEIL